jgi:hypothetical protein
MKTRAPLTSIAALFLATGTAHAERYTPTPTNYLPPLEYDKPFVGRLQEFIVKDRDELAGICPEIGAIGCAGGKPATESDPPICVIWLAPDEIIRKFGLTTEIVRRHEIGHCNGWRHSKIDPWSLKVK